MARSRLRDEIFEALAAIGFTGGMAMESSITVAPQVADALSIWRSVAPSREVVLDEGCRSCGTRPGSEN